DGEGEVAATTNCGSLLKYRQALAAAALVPVFTSRLLLVPLVHRLLPAGRLVGGMTVNAGTLGPEHLRGAGIGSEIPIAVVGMEAEKELTRVLLGAELELDGNAAREEHVREARRLVSHSPHAEAIVRAGTTLPAETP